MPCVKSSDFTSTQWITAPYAELSYDGEFGFATDSTYSFTLNCKKPYCSEDGLYAVIVVDAE